MDKLHVAVELIKLLKSRKCINSKTVANELNVSLRTAQRYLSEISYIPGILYDEKKHCYCLIEEKKFNEIIFNNEELSLLSAILDYASSILGSNSENTVKFIKKKILHINSNRDISRFITINSIDFDKIAKCNGKLENLIKDEINCKFKYLKNNKEYSVSPLKILYDKGFWYLAAKHNDKIKKFSLDYIEEIKELNGESKFYDKKHKKELEELLKNASNIWFEQGEEIFIKAIVNDKISDYFRRKICLPNQKIISENNNGKLEIEFSVTSKMEFMESVVQWLPNIEIIKPEKYRKLLYDFGKKVMASNK